MPTAEKMKNHLCSQILLRNSSSRCPYRRRGEIVPWNVTLIKSKVINHFFPPSLRIIYITWGIATCSLQSGGCSPKAFWSRCFLCTRRRSSRGCHSPGTKRSSCPCSHWVSRALVLSLHPSPYRVMGDFILHQNVGLANICMLTSMNLQKGKTKYKFKDVPCFKRWTWLLYHESSA